jgi:hypothetical protein
MKTYLQMADEFLENRHARRLASLLSAIECDDVRCALREQYDERMAICTIDGGLSESDASVVALAEIESAIGQRQAR